MLLVNISSATKLTLLLLSITTMMSNVAIVTTLPHLKDHFTTVENIEFLSRLMLTLPSLSIALLAPFLGHIVYRVGRRSSALAALSLFAVAGSAGLYLDSMEELLASRSLLGVAIATLMITATSLVGDYFQGEKRHKFMGLQSAFIAVGGIFFVVGGGFLSDFHWRSPFAIYLVGLLLLPLVYKFLLEKEHTQTTSDEGLDNSLLGIYFLGFLLMLLFFILPTQIPFLIINHFGASGSLTGAIISSAFVANAIGALSFSKFKRHFSFAKLYVLGMFIISVGFILIGLVSNVYLFFLTSPIMGFGGGLLMTTTSAWMLSLAHQKRRVKSSGYLTSSLFFGQFFSPILFHPFVSYLGVQNFFISIGLVILIGNIIIISYIKFIRKN